MQRRLYERKKDGPVSCGTCRKGWHEKRNTYGCTIGAKVEDLKDVVRVTSPCSGQVSEYPIYTVWNERKKKNIPVSVIAGHPHVPRA